MESHLKIVREGDPFNPETAVVAGGFPVAPPREWFEDPKLDRVTPITVTAAGQVYGHIAAWNQAHIGIPGSVKPPRSKSKYGYFRTGMIACADGSQVPVGQLTLSGGHAPLSADASAAVRHYDDTASAVVDMAAGEDKHGIWVAGAVRPDATDSQVRALRASAPSGDWRPINGNLELVAVCQVNVPGFPIARACVASAGAVTALVAAGAQDMLMRRYREVDPEFVEVNALSQEISDLRSVVASLQAHAKAEVRSRVRN